MMQCPSSSSIKILKLTGLCCPILESTTDQEARRSVSQLESNPIPIWWHRKRVDPAPPSASLLEAKKDNSPNNAHGRGESGNWHGLHAMERGTNNGRNNYNNNNNNNSSTSSTIDNNELSPFPKSWSINYTGSLLDEIHKEYHSDDDDNHDKEGELHNENKSLATDDSSVFSTVSQEQRQKQRQLRDEFGNCRKHPHVQLAEKQTTSNGGGDHNKKNGRFSKPFFIRKNNHNRNVSSSSIISSSNEKEEEWKIILDKCPECDKERIEQLKMRYHYSSTNNNSNKSKQQHQRNQSNLWGNGEPSSTPAFPRNKNDVVSYMPFPATLTLIETLPELLSDDNISGCSSSGCIINSSSMPALRVRTEPIPVDQISQLSFAIGDGSSTNVDDDEYHGGGWSTPDGALDFFIPCDANGNSIPSKELASCDDGATATTVTTTTDKAREKEQHHQLLPQYKIMERIIPLLSIDHVSRGGDAWDVLRQSTGEDDLGCMCNVKIHGFSDRLLRFDVVNFDAFNAASTTRNDNTAKGFRFGDGTTRLRRTFVGVDLFRSSISGVMANYNQSNNPTTDNNGRDNGANNTTTETYTPENVISTLNSLVLWDRERRERGVDGWGNCFSTFVEECLSLGAAKAGKESVPVVAKRTKGTMIQDGRHDIS